MNMKAILNKKLQRDGVTTIEDSSNDEYLQVADEEYHTKDQTPEEIQDEFRHTPNFPEEAWKDKSKHKVFEFEIFTCSKPLDIEELNEQEDHAHQKVMESLS